MSVWNVARSQAEDSHAGDIFDNDNVYDPMQLNSYRTATDNRSEIHTV